MKTLILETTCIALLIRKRREQQHSVGSCPAVRLAVQQWAPLHYQLHHDLKVVVGGHELPADDHSVARRERGIVPEYTAQDLRPAPEAHERDNFLP